MRMPDLAGVDTSFCGGRAIIVTNGHLFGLQRAIIFCDGFWGLSRLPNGGSADFWFYSGGGDGLEEEGEQAGTLIRKLMHLGKKEDGFTADPCKSNFLPRRMRIEDTLSEEAELAYFFATSS